MTLLSVFVKHYTKSQLQQMIPGLTIWREDQSRKHAAVVGAGVTEGWQYLVRYRLDSQKLDHFLDFISCPHYIQDVAYGTKKPQMSIGEVLQIPDVVRTVLSSRMVALYQNYCCETEFEPLARSTLFAVLKVCAASKKKSLGWDPGALPKLLKNVACGIAPSLMTLYNSCIELGRWPCAWKMGEWTPVFKKGDRQLAKNYRPITSLVTVNKTFEHMLSLDSVKSEGSLAFDTLEAAVHTIGSLDTRDRKRTASSTLNNPLIVEGACGEDH
ncbi:hypothetical protein AWC38_SpisGene18211 [Stylophora pistillata]|uniref:RNA-directed DNA polymerase from mobile element jockey n=1 Tax=Stylophora pistillata TaxID=50429 RepID=A0A2B4RMI0_STYPI|nr:hypothetical protein AWC38_SpisGene18211 [Stylophora pistillata]